MPPDTLMQAEGTTYAATSPRDIQGTGGFDHDSIAFGDWTWLSTTSMKFYGRAIQGDYNYRNVPCSHGNTSSSVKSPVNIGWTKPEVSAYPGEAPFKTQKILASRALVSDSFSQPSGDPTYWSIGKAFYAHRDGYNVLYGDWSASWYGDPKQRIAWWPEMYGSPTSGYHSQSNNISINNITDGTLGPGHNAFNTTYHKPNGSAAVWHVLDVGHGMDVY